MFEELESEKQKEANFIVMETVKQIPYGMSNFEDVIMQNRYYVDKTMYIPLLEDQANYLIFIRPRRFGKSLLLSMLRSYYDLSQKDKFQQLFGNLWIGQHTTPLQGKYQILYLDFSKIGGSIDELPQLFNILKGNMSLVGPRPERPFFVEKFREEIPRYMVKHQVRPGLTGWAQVNGYRGDTSIRKRIEYDLYYIENWSIGLDIKIIFLTFFKGFINKNAY